MLNEDEHKIFENIVIYSVPIHKINASTIKTDENEYLVIITDRLMALLHTWNELQTKIGMTRDISKEDVARAFAPIVDSYLTPNSILHFWRYITDNIFATLHFGLFDMVEGSKIYIKRQ